MTTHHVVVLAGGIDPHDSGVRQVAAFAARLGYLFMCLTLCWGILTATGWVRRASGHQALRSGHMMLASATVAFVALHAVGLALLDERVLHGIDLVVPFLNGSVRHALGIISLDLMLVLVATASLHRWVRYRSWLRFHQLAYVAFALGVVHAWLGAWANSSFEIYWLAGITATVPVLVLGALRVLPARLLAGLGLIDAAAPAVRLRHRSAPLEISVDNQRCHRYGFCQAEAPDVFRLREDGRLQYRGQPEVTLNAAVRSAVRACPMRAIQLKESRRRGSAARGGNG
ncbi:ferredoxin [Krasilnikovia sp. MM14-A1004]|uniref:ferredoxin n=1 Tax=Krasilnikovia sp. MM14-A1004 TaxID=3373541 RepID=UPI00399CEFFE